MMSEYTEPLVSICCISYNHEKYISKALESFLMQETDFPFEILIHDDASTDNTASIVREYAEKYPIIIKPIIQTENQQSKGIKVNIEFNFSRSKGKYIAVCEGDDYWIDHHKLQKQVNEMQKYPQFKLCFHPALEKWVDNSEKDKVVSSYSKESKIFGVREVILMGGGGMPTSSLLLRKEVVPEITIFFDMAKEALIQDFYVQVLASIDKGALFIPDVMSVYQRGIEGSWSNKVESCTKDELLDVWTNITLVNQKMDAFTNHAYSNEFALINKKRIIDILVSPRVEIEAKKKIFQSNKNHMTFKEKLLWYTLLNDFLVIKVLSILGNSTWVSKIYWRLREK